MTRLKAALELAVPLSLAEIPVLNIPLFIPAGFLAVMTLAERGMAVAAARRVVALAGAAIAVAAEVAHGAGGIPIRWEAAATNALAIALGAWMAHR